MNRLIERKKNILALSIKCVYMSVPVLGMWFCRLSKLFSKQLLYTCLITIKSNTCNTGKFKWTVGGRRVSFPIFFINCIKWETVFMLPFKQKGSITSRRSKESYFPISVHLVVGLTGVWFLKYTWEQHGSVDSLHQRLNFSFSLDLCWDR